MSCVRFLKQGATLACLDGSTPIMYIYSSGNVLVPCLDGGVGYVGGTVAKALLQMGTDPSWLRYGDIVYGLPSAARLWKNFYKNDALAVPEARPKKILEIKAPPKPGGSKVAPKDGTDDFGDRCILCLKADRDAVLSCGHSTMCGPCHYVWMFDKARKGKSAPACNLCNAPVNETCSTSSCSRPWANRMACGCKLCAVCVLRSWNTKEITMDCRCCSVPTYSTFSRHAYKNRL